MIAVMGPEAAVNAVYFNKIAEKPEAERAAYVEKLRDEYRADIDLLKLAADLLVDAVVPGDDLRAELVRRLAAAEGKTRDRLRAPPPRPASLASPWSADALDACLCPLREARASSCSGAMSPPLKLLPADEARRILARRRRSGTSGAGGGRSGRVLAAAFDAPAICPANGGRSWTGSRCARRTCAARRRRRRSRWR